MYCREACLVKIGRDHAIATSLKCRSWGCEHCQPQRQAQLKELARAGEPDTFITLTIRSNYPGGNDGQARALADAWRIVVKRHLRRTRLRRFEYLAVFEAHKDGRPHLHILARCRWLDRRWLSACMDELLGSPVVDVRRVRGGRQVANYIAKYVGKQPGAFGKSKRYWHTRKWRRVAKERGPADGVTWLNVTRKLVPASEVARHFAALGLLVAQLSKDRWQALYPPDCTWLASKLEAKLPSW